MSAEWKVPSPGGHLHSSLFSLFLLQLRCLLVTGAHFMLSDAHATSLHCTAQSNEQLFRIFTKVKAIIGKPKGLQSVAGGDTHGLAGLEYLIIPMG